MKRIKFIRIFLLVLIVIGIGLLVTQKMWVPKVVAVILKNDKKEQSVSLDGYTELHFSIMKSGNSQTKNVTSEVVNSDIPISKKITVYTPSDTKDGRIGIKNVITGTSCDTANFLVEKLFLSSDEKTLLVYNYSGSSHYLTSVDTATCKNKGETKTLAVNQVSKTSTKMSKSFVKEYEITDVQCKEISDHEIVTALNIDVKLTDLVEESKTHWKKMTATKDGKILWSLLAIDTGYENFDEIDDCSPDGKYAVIYQSYNINYSNERQVGGGGSIFSMVTGEHVIFVGANDDNFIGFEKGKAHTALVETMNGHKFSEVLPLGE